MLCQPGKISVINVNGLDIPRRRIVAVALLQQLHRFKEKEENIYTGLLKSENCYGHEKVNRLNEWASSNETILNVQSAWGDHLSDFDLLSLSANRYWVADEKLRKLVIQRDPEANFVDTDIK